MEQSSNEKKHAKIVQESEIELTCVSEATTVLYTLKNASSTVSPQHKAPLLAINMTCRYWKKKVS